MAYYLVVAIVIIESFLLGSIPFGVIIGRVYGGDPRSGGSGSIGATNMGRMFGWKASAATFICDVLKGALAVVIARLFAAFVIMTEPWQFELLISLPIIFSILGHIFSPWLGFKGGKGISTGLGSILVAYPLVVACMLATFIVVVLITRRVSAGSICAAISFPIFAYVFCGLDVPLLVVGVLTAVVVIYAHRGNIKRMIEGTEPKITDKKKGQEPQEVSVNSGAADPQAGQDGGAGR